VDKLIDKAKFFSGCLALLGGRARMAMKAYGLPVEIKERSWGRNRTVLNLGNKHRSPRDLGELRSDLESGHCDTTHNILSSIDASSQPACGICHSKMVITFKPPVHAATRYCVRVLIEPSHARSTLGHGISHNEAFFLQVSVRPESGKWEEILSSQAWAVLGCAI
jgi:hypothetical protein